MNNQHVLVQHHIDLGLVQTVIDNYKNEPGGLIPVLQKTQEIYGYLPLPVLEVIAEELKIKRAKVYSTATFYTQFRFKPVGKHLILLCQGTACHVNGSERIAVAIQDELKVAMGETTSDGVFTLDEAACLGCCGLAPVMMINGQAYGPLTPDKARQIVRKIYAEELEVTREGVEK